MKSKIKAGLMTLGILIAFIFIPALIGKLKERFFGLDFSEFIEPTFWTYHLTGFIVILIAGAIAGIIYFIYFILSEWLEDLE